MSLLQKEYEIVCVANLDNLSSSSVKTLDDLGVRFIQVDVSRKGINPYYDLKYLFKLFGIYKKENPLVILHFTIKPNIYGTIASRLANIPSINTINGLGSAIIKENFLSTILKYLYKFSLFFSSKILFQNDDDKNFFISQNLVDKNKVSIVPGSGVDTQSFFYCEADTLNLTFLLVARLLKDKGIYEYVEASKVLKIKYPNIVFLLAGQFDNGNPTAINESEVLQWEKDGSIKFLGKSDDIRMFFKQCDIAVLPSYREGLSRFLIEAASASKPIITTNVPGCKDVVEDNVNGFLCAEKNAQSLKDTIEKMILLDKEKLEEMKKKSKKIAVNKFDKEIINNIYLSEITKI